MAGVWSLGRAGLPGRGPRRSLTVRSTEWSGRIQLDAVGPGDHRRFRALWQPGHQAGKQLAYGRDHRRRSGHPLEERGIFGLQSISNGSLGDAILFFRQPRPTTPATKVTIGGLSGERTDLTIAPGVQSHQGDCPVQTCVWMFRGRAATWVWDWSFAGPERQRLYLLTAADGVIAIFVDSLDGSTFDALTKAADQILATVKFDRR